MAPRAKRIAGIDGCRSGWIIVDATLNLNDLKWKIVPAWNAIASDAHVIAVDMPIGLSEDGARQCEVEARRLLSPCGSRVFKSLPRGALCFRQEDWGKANQWSKAQGHGGLSRQIWNIRPKIMEIEASIDPGQQRRIHEAHPELAFARLNAGRALPPKRTAEGLALRVRLLEAAGFPPLGGWMAALRGQGAKGDDLLDACALVLTARHIALGTAVQLPARPARDARGLRMSITY